LITLIPIFLINFNLFFINVLTDNSQSYAPFEVDKNLFSIICLS